MIPEYLYYYRLEREGQDVAADDERLYVHFDIFEHLNQSIGSTKDQRLIDNYKCVKYKHIDMHFQKYGKNSEMSI